MPTNPDRESNASPSPQIDEDLAAVLEERDATRQKKKRGSNLLLLAILLAVPVGGAVYYQTNPAFQAEVKSLLKTLKDGGKDVASVADPTAMKKQFDGSLQKVASRNTDLGNAAGSMGVDTAKVTEDGMNSEMKGMMGGGGRTVADRNALLKNKVDSFAPAQAKQAGQVIPAKPETTAQHAVPSPAIANPTAAPNAPANAKTRPAPKVHEEPLVIE
ncbi:MAG: hypothetical protein V4733_09330 [Verrucomicrobiota bacterium]